MLRARLYYDTCAPLLRHVRASTSTSMYVHVRDQNDNTTYASTRWVPTFRHFLACEDVAGGSQQSGGESFFFLDALPCVLRCSRWVPAVRGANRFFSDALPCVRRCSWWVPAVRGKYFFREIQWPVQWVPAVRGRYNYFPRNKEALPCCGRGPSCQPLHVQSTSDGSRSLTTLTTPRREHQGSG